MSGFQNWLSVSDSYPIRADALYVCYCLDREAGTQRRQEVIDAVRANVSSLTEVLTNWSMWSSRDRDQRVLCSDSVFLSLDGTRTVPWSCMKVSLSF